MSLYTTKGAIWHFYLFNMALPRSVAGPIIQGTGRHAFADCLRLRSFRCKMLSKSCLAWIGWADLQGSISSENSQTRQKVWNGTLLIFIPARRPDDRDVWSILNCDEYYCSLPSSSMGLEVVTRSKTGLNCSAWMYRIRETFRTYRNKKRSSESQVPTGFLKETLEENCESNHRLWMRKTNQQNFIENKDISVFSE